jgi:hypothetical protein
MIPFLLFWRVMVKIGREKEDDPLDRTRFPPPSGADVSGINNLWEVLKIEQGQHPLPRIRGHDGERISENARVGG